jgi:hypothetical protein
MCTYRFVLFALVSAIVTGCAPIIAPMAAPTAAPTPAVYRFDDLARRSVAAAESLGTVTFPTGATFADTEVGGLSAVAYDAAHDHYYILSDDRSQRAPARVYTALIDLADGELEEGDVTFQEVITLTDAAGAPYVTDSIDPEGLALAADGRLFLSSEGDGALLPPFVGSYTRAGRASGELPLPDYYLPSADGTMGVRSNQVFESVTLSPDQRTLTTAVENALVQDGPAADLDQSSPSRFLSYEVATGAPIHEWVYGVDAVPVAPEPESGVRDNGIADLLALDNRGTFLVLERSYIEGVGNDIRLYEANVEGADDVLGRPSLGVEGEMPEAGSTVAKRLVANLSELGIDPDNVEGMAFGPRLADGRQSLILVSDNNFNPAQTTQVIGLGLEIERVDE